MNTNTHLNLSDYLTAVKLAVSEIFDQDIWVACQIRAVNSKGGHYYFELADSQENGVISASCRGTLWRYIATSVIHKFEKTTNHKLQAGLKILVRGRAVFHAQYGFSFNINDINPAYTLGELAQAYTQMKQKLIDNGLMIKNKSLDMPFDIYNVAVIAPQNAAGLGDFRAEADRLTSKGVCQFDYYEATFQGNDAPNSICQAVSRLLTASVDYDIVVIIRGGGATGDLAYLNDYELAKTVAQIGIPVWVGIGHERDKGILDEIAHTCFDTPSKVIFGIEKYIVNTWQTAKNNYHSITKISYNNIQYYQKNIDTLLAKTKMIIIYKNNDYQKQTMHLLNTIQQFSRYRLQNINHKTEKIFSKHAIYKNILKNKEKQSEYLYQFIKSQDPQKQLKKGYAIVRQNGKIVSRIGDIVAQDKLTICFQDGQLTVELNKVQFEKF